MEEACTSGNNQQQPQQETKNKTKKNCLLLETKGHLVDTLLLSRLPFQKANKMGKWMLGTGTVPGAPKERPV